MRGAPTQLVGPDRRRWLWVLAYALVAFAFWGSRSVWETTEARYAQAAREMATTGEWLVPRVEGQARLTKPPVAYWVFASGVLVFGENEWGVRFGQSAVFFGAMLAVAALARAWGASRHESGLAGLIFGSAGVPFIAGHYLSTDMTLVMFQTVGVLGAWRAARAPSGRDAIPWRWVCWIAFALAFETKGPPALLPLGAMLLFLALERRLLRRDAPGALRPTAPLLTPLSFAAFTILAGAWFVVISLRTPGALDYFLRGEILDRLFRASGGAVGGLRDAMNPRPNGLWVYALTLIPGFFPWVFLWPQMFLRAHRAIGRGWSSLAPTQRFTFLWIGLTLGALTLASSRMPLYTLPLFVPLSVWGARVFFRRVRDEIRETRWIRWSSTAMLIAGACTGLVFVLCPDRVWTPRFLRDLAPMVEEFPPTLRPLALAANRAMAATGARTIHAPTANETPRSILFSLPDGAALTRDPSPPRGAIVLAPTNAQDAPWQDHWEVLESRGGWSVGRVRFGVGAALLPGEERPRAEAANRAFSDH